MTLRTLNYGNYGIFLIMGNAGFCPSTVCLMLKPVFSFYPVAFLILLLLLFHPRPYSNHKGPSPEQSPCGTLEEQAFKELLLMIQAPIS